jgi:hypothetical protein
MVKRRPKAFTLTEVCVVFSLLLGFLLILYRPTQTILTYPTKVGNQRADRIAGQKVYNSLYLDLRNGLNGRLWTTTLSSGDVLCLLVSATGHDNADSEGDQAYVLWRYSPESGVLSRRKWLTTELSSEGLPIVNQEPTNEEWNKFTMKPLKPMAYHVTKFSLVPALPMLRVEYQLKNSERTGKVESYQLEVVHP